MSNTELDLWPDDIGHSKLIAPVAILRRQASLLGEKTKNIVKGDVTSHFDQQRGAFSYSFLLVAPALDNYRYKLFSIYHKVLFYPLELYPEIDPDKTIENQDELLEALKKEFNSEKTRGVIQSMIAQSEGLTDDAALAS